MRVTGIRHGFVFTRSPEAESASEGLCVKRTKDSSPQGFCIITINFFSPVRACVNPEVTHFALGEYIVMIFNFKNCLSLRFR
jgi:hypothetical protein